MNGRRRVQWTLVGLALVAFVLVGALLWTQGQGQSSPAAPAQGVDSPLAAPAAATSPLAEPPAAPASPLAAPEAGAGRSLTATGDITTPAAMTAAAGVTGTEAISITAPATTVAAPVRTPVVVSVVEAARPPLGPIPIYGYEVVEVYPHDPQAYTQGLHYLDGTLYEGTGLRGQSSLRRVDLATGEVLQQVDLEQAHFGEGIVVLDDRIIQLTWQSNVAFVYDRESFERIGEFTYPTEGWGLTTDGVDLWMSDGSSQLYRRDPATFAELGRVTVTANGDRVILLNELEYIAGAIWANVYQTDRIVIVDPKTGNVVGMVDLSGLLATVPVAGPVDVLNGIAYDVAGDRLFVTGKWWPALFEIRLVAE